MIQKIHLIAIGGSVMHNLALALHHGGHIVSGSDDQIYEPAKSRLSKAGIMPPEEGWFPEKINAELDLVILGMHAKDDNPELKKALQLGLKVSSFPEFVFSQFKEKQRLVVAGSHGKTTTTSMLMHVLKKLSKKFDYLVGAQLEGFNEMVSFTDADLALIEGDEYLSSCMDKSPKFLHYKPQIAIITGIAWDHYNVFPTYDLYKKAFSDFILSMPTGGNLIYFEKDPELVTLIGQFGTHLNCIPYKEAPYVQQDQETYLIGQSACYKLNVFGKHNLQNIQSIRLACNLLGISELDCNEAISDFKGASRRMELLEETEDKFVFQDFAHAPSKVKATLEAIREKFKTRKVLAIQELHTYSSLNKAFIPQYLGTMNPVDNGIIFFDKKALEIKRMPELEEDFIRQSFGRSDLLVINESDILKEQILKIAKSAEVVLFLGSGNFGGLNIRSLAKEIVNS
ncbi:MAG: hypothetical protein KA251_06530 [Saprospiraceae bacterium]|nr:peptidoglycan synthetase [Candidatus Vicinibacter affinis]MBK8403630.1 peptidoglycan synthetase [Candidatus Vicinibacter affinis]MBP6522627.1 hypothetical protein [Saprospiraceae bacterium]